MASLESKSAFKKFGGSPSKPMGLEDPDMADDFDDEQPKETHFADEVEEKEIIEQVDEEEKNEDKEIFFQARIADEAKCYDHMIKVILPLMDKRAEFYERTGRLEFTQKEKNFFCRAFKQHVEPKRQTLKTLVALLHSKDYVKGKDDTDTCYRNAIRYYKNKVY